MTGQIKIRIRHRMRKGQWFDYLLVSRDEMKQILAGTGWRVARFIEPDPKFMASAYCAIIEKNEATLD